MAIDLTSLPGLPQPALHEDPGWYAQAACHTLPPDLFFPAGRTGSGADLAEAAKRVCARCPVAGPCLEFALETNQEYGVWGGTTEEERRCLRRRARALGARPAGAPRDAAG
ncbi:MAG: WhiB family transcriptional regulator [Acidimicrobiales bacterium]